MSFDRIVLATFLDNLQ